MCKNNNFTKSFDELLALSKTVSIHTRNLRLLVTEIYKSLNFISPQIMWDTFPLKSARYNLRQGSKIIVPCAKSARAINSFDFRAALAWNQLQSQIKSKSNLSDFKSSIKNCKIYCQCKFCRT